MTEVLNIEKLEAFRFVRFLSLDLLSKAIRTILCGSFLDDHGTGKKLSFFERAMSLLAREHMEDMVTSGVDMGALKAEFEVMTDILEPCEMCMVHASWNFCQGSQWSARRTA